MRLCCGLGFYELYYSFYERRHTSTHFETICPDNRSNLAPLGDRDSTIWSDGHHVKEPLYLPRARRGLGPSLCFLMQADSLLEIYCTFPKRPAVTRPFTHTATSRTVSPPSLLENLKDQY